MSSPTDDKKSDPSAASLTQKVGDAAQDTYTKAKDALGGVGQTLRDPKEALQNAGEYAQKGGAAAYDAVADHPVIAAAAGALGAYLLLRPAPDPRDRYLDLARDYARHARKWAPDVDWSELDETGRSYAKRANEALDRSPVSSNHLLLLAGVSLVAWLVTTSTTSQSHPSTKKDR